MENEIIDEDMVLSMEYRQLIKPLKQRPVWVKYSVNEIGRIAKGVGGKEDRTDTMFFIEHKKILGINGKM